MAPIPITIITGFLGSGKTTLILNLLPQLPPTYKVALLKNEFGDVAVDSQLAASASISGVRELVNGCLCCNLVGQLGDALATLKEAVQPDRIVIETSGSAFPATLAMEVNRLGRETGNYVLDGVISVIDVENWQGYEDTSYTAKLQAQYTDLVVLNKWEFVSERRYDDVLDRIGDLELQVATVKSNKGYVDQNLLLGLDGALARKMTSVEVSNGHSHDHEHGADHHSEVEVLSISLVHSSSTPAFINLDALESFLLAAPKDEIYRIKAIAACATTPKSSDGTMAFPQPQSDIAGRFILNWAFSRWTFTAIKKAKEVDAISVPTEKGEPVLRMTVICARCESSKWKKRLEEGALVKLEEEPECGLLTVVKIS